MRKYALLLFMLFMALILQGTLLDKISIAGVKPDIILVLVICTSVVCGPKRGGIIGLVFGLLEDIYLGRFIGMNAMTKGLTGIITGWITLGAFGENLLVPVVTVFLGTILQGLLYFLTGELLGLNWTIGLGLSKIIPVAIYNMCIVPFIYPRYYYFAQGLGDFQINFKLWKKLS